MSAYTISNRAPSTNSDISPDGAVNRNRTYDPHRVKVVLSL
jgi:hypothetical protein